MKPAIVNILLWLFVIVLGIAFGAGIYEHRVLFPLWLVETADGASVWDAAAANAANSGLRFWALVSTGPLTVLTIANLVLAWRARGRIRRWWLGAAVAALGDRLLTFTYFIPTMITLMQPEALSPAEAVATAARWGTLNHLRHLLVLVAWMCALKTFRQFERSPDRG